MANLHGSFDSILVRLKVTCALAPCERSNVSIPYWFD